MREKVRSFTAAAYAGSTFVERVMKFAFNRKNGYLLGDYGQKIYEQTMASAFFLNSMRMRLRADSSDRVLCET